jgi:hypothetical protein
MIAKTPTPVRWAEEAEAGRVCTLALLEPEPESAASRPTQIAAECSFFQAMLLRWLWSARLEPAEKARR